MSTAQTMACFTPGSCRGAVKTRKHRSSVPSLPWTGSHASTLSCRAWFRRESKTDTRSGHWPQEGPQPQPSGSFRALRQPMEPPGRSPSMSTSRRPANWAAASAILLRCRKREGDAALAVELPAQVAVDGVQRGLLLFVLQGDVVQRATLLPIGRGGTDRVIAERDQVNGCSGVRRRSGPVGLLSVLVVLASGGIGALHIDRGWGGRGRRRRIHNGHIR